VCARCCLGLPARRQEGRCGM